jgi:hypothetical protein
MRLLNLLACSAIVAVVLAVGAAAAEPNVGVLSVEQGKGVVMLDIRGSVLGRLTSGSLRVTDLTPRDRYTGLVVGRKLTQERIGPRIILYRGQGLRFRMVGGGYRIVVRGTGIDLSAVGRGLVTVQGERKFPDEDAGVFSLDGIDCELEPTSCTPLPDFPERYILEPAEADSPRAMVVP